MTVLTRGEIADLRERSKVVNVRFSAQIVSDLVETIESLSRALDDERTHGAIEAMLAKGERKQERDRYQGSPGM